MTDLFGEETVPKAKREVSKADAEKLSRISYQRRSRHAPATGCHDCITNKQSPTGVKSAVAPAVYVRSHGGEQIALCYGHKQERQDRERLNSRNSGT